MRERKKRTNENRNPYLSRSNDSQHQRIILALFFFQIKNQHSISIYYTMHSMPDRKIPLVKNNIRNTQSKRKYWKYQLTRGFRCFPFMLSTKRSADEWMRYATLVSSCSLSIYTLRLHKHTYTEQHSDMHNA